MEDNKPRYICAKEVHNVLSWPLVNEAVEEAIKASANQSPTDDGASYACQPARQRAYCNDNKGILFTMPGYVGNYQRSSTDLQLNKKQEDDGKNDSHCSTLACKLVTYFPYNASQVPPLPVIMANILLFSPRTGQIKCIMDATQITAWRTAAASIVATGYLYFQNNPELKANSIQLAIIGCGTQGESHALGMCETYNVSHVYLWNRTPARAHALAEKLRSMPKQRAVQVHVAETAEDAVMSADVICVGTSSSEALVSLEMLRKTNVHINAVGAGQKVHFGEVAQNIYDKARMYIDSWATANVELKDLKANIVDEVGQIIRTQQYPPRDGITIFQSLGMTSEDATVAQAVYDTIKDKEL